MTSEQALRRAADIFHEIGMAIAADALVVNVRNAVLATKLRENQRTRDQFHALAEEGFELCTCTFVKVSASGAADDVSTPAERALVYSGQLFHEILMAYGLPDHALLHRTPDQLRAITADGFELCVRALASMGASDVTIHECNERSLEEHW